jgi:hypothetical protein
MAVYIPDHTAIPDLFPPIAIPLVIANADHLGAVPAVPSHDFADSLELCGHLPIGGDLKNVPHDLVGEDPAFAVNIAARDVAQ